MCGGARGLQSRRNLTVCIFSSPSTLPSRLTFANCQIYIYIYRSMWGPALDDLVTTPLKNKVYWICGYGHGVKDDTKYTNA